LIYVITRKKWNFCYNYRKEIIYHKLLKTYLIPFLAHLLGKIR